MSHPNSHRLHTDCPPPPAVALHVVGTKVRLTHTAQMSLGGRKMTCWRRGAAAAPTSTPRSSGGWPARQRSTNAWPTSGGSVRSRRGAQPDTLPNDGQSSDDEAESDDDEDAPLPGEMESEDGVHLLLACVAVNMGKVDLENSLYLWLAGGKCFKVPDARAFSAAAVQ